MTLVRSSKLNLPNPSLSASSSSPSPQVSSILYEPISSSLSLTLSDSAISLYPSLSPISTPCLSYPQTLIPSPCSSSSFLLLRSSQYPNSIESPPRVFFIVAGPYCGASRLLLRFYCLREGKVKGFTRAKVICDQKGIEFDHEVGVLLDLSNGVSVKIVGSTNYFAIYSVSSSKVIIFGVKVVADGAKCGDDDDDDDEVVVKLIRCGVIECCRPVWSIGIFSRFLVLGEDNGVRVLNLREIVKGKSKKDNVRLSQDKRLRNGHSQVKKDVPGVNKGLQRQESSETRMCFVPFQKNYGEDQKQELAISVRAVSIQALSVKSFMILDSTGYVHLLYVSGPLGSSFACHMQQLPHFTDVQKLALVPELSAGTKSLWISDGDYSVHRVKICVGESTTTNKEKDEEENKIREERGSDLGAVTTHTIFSQEKIQDLVPLGENGALILGIRKLLVWLHSVRDEPLIAEELETY